MAQSPNHIQTRIQRQQILTGNINLDANHADTDTVYMTDNICLPSSSSSRYSSNATYPQYQLCGKEEEELYHKYNALSKNFTSSAQTCPQQHYISRGRKLQLQPKLQVQRDQKSLSLPRRSKPNEDSGVDDGSNVDDDHQRQLHNRGMYTKTRTSILHPPPKSTSCEENQDDYYSNASIRSISSHNKFSCVSSLSANDSYYYISNLVPVVQNPPPVLIICYHRREICRGGAEEAGASVQAPHQHQPYENESAIQTLSSKISGSAPHQVASPGPRKLRKSSPDSTVKKKNYGRDTVRNRRGKLESVSAKVLSGKQQHYPWDQNYSLPCLRRAVSTSTRISSYASVQRHEQMYATVPCDNKNCGKDCSIIPPRTTVSRHAISRLKRRKSTSAVLPSNTSSPVTQCRNHRRCHSDRAIGGLSNSITSASYGSMHQSSIIVNGRAINDIKRRPSENVSLMLGGSRGTGGEDHNYRQDFVYKAAIRGVLADLEHSKSFDTQLTDTLSSIESLKHTLNRSQTTLIDDAAMRSSGIIDSSTTDIVSTSSGKTIQRNRRRRNRRSMRKFIVGKIVPAPLRTMKAVLTKKRTYHLKRSVGFLT